MGILWEHYGNIMERLWEYYENTIGILWEYYANKTGLVDIGVILFCKRLSLNRASRSHAKTGFHTPLHRNH